MVKTILAAVMASAFLISMPVRAEEKAAGEKTEAASKGEKKAKKEKKEKKEEGAKEEKAGGGW